MVPRFQEASAAHNVAIADAVREFAQRKGCTPAQIAIAWVLAQGEDILPIPGMKTRAHLADNLGTLAVRLSRAELEQLARRVDELAVQGERQAPAMMQLIER
jgi:aryl-alcohol dehydrogenase-like predicted oxidoreductase